MNTRPLFYSVLSFVITFLVMSRALTSDVIYFWDDEYIIYNMHLRTFTANSLKWMFTYAVNPSYVMPVSWLVFAAVTVASGVNPFAWHLAQLTCHAASAALMVPALTAILPMLFRKGSVTNQPALLAGFAGATVWAVHPMRVEVALSIPVFPYSLAMTLLLLAFNCHVSLAKSGGGPRLLAPRNLLGLFFFGLALLSHPQGVSFAPLLLLPHLAGIRGGGIGRVMLRVALPIACLVAACGILAIITRSDDLNTVSLAEFTLGQRLVQSCYVAVYYLARPFFTFHYSPLYTRLLDVGFGIPVFPLALAGCIALTILALMNLRRHPVPAGLWLLHLAMTAPVWGVMSHPHCTNDRYGHIPGILGAIAVGSVAIRFYGCGIRGRMIFTGGLGLILALLSVLSFSQAGIWRDSAALHDHVADQWMRRGVIEGGSFTKSARSHLEGGSPQVTVDRATAVLSVSPDDFAALELLVAGLSRLNRHAEAKGAMERLLRLPPVRLEDHACLAEALLELGGDSPDVIYAHSRKAVEGPWGNPRLAVIHARSCRLLSRMDEALQMANEALARYPHLPGARIERAAILLDIGDAQAAGDDVSWCAGKFPDALETQLLRARLELGRGRAASAVPILEGALRRDPADARFMAVLGLTLLELGQATDGIQWLEAAVASHPGAFHGDPLRERALLKLGQSAGPVRRESGD